MYSSFVFVSIRFTHQHGSRLPDNRNHPRGTIEGELLTYIQQSRQGSFMVATLRTPSDSVSPPLAALYSVSLYTISPLALHLRGLEQTTLGGEEAYVLQGWIVTPR